MWRWDQGRLTYFQFDILKRMASVLVKYDGIKIKGCEDMFRKELMANTGMPFAPSSYTVLRNYKRVFECSFLATVKDDCLIATSFAHELTKSNNLFENADNFFLCYVKRFRFPFPAFDNYDESSNRVYPFCAIIKFLVALSTNGKEPKLSIDDIFHYIIANNCTGKENLSFYSELTVKSCHIDDTTRRQIREMIIFISQLSFLKYYKDALWLDSADEDAIKHLVEQYLVPIGGPPSPTRFDEFMNMTRLTEQDVPPQIEAFVSNNTLSIDFAEGTRKLVEHFRVDRSPLLRKYYVSQNPHPICAMCGMDIKEKYPWTNYMIDIHHLLPLSSAIAITTKGTSLEDIVGLCPSCHRSVHIYYDKWLKSMGQEDFKSKEEAHAVYCTAVKEMHK